MALRDEMRQLTRNLLDAHDRRSAAVLSIRTNTRQELDELNAARRAMAVEQQQQLNEQMKRLRRNADALHQEAATFIQELEAAHQAMATEQGQYLTGWHARLAADTATFREETATTHRTMADEQQEQLDEYMDRLRRNADKMRQETADLMEELEAAHQAMAAAQRQWLTEEHTQMVQSVDAMRAKLQAKQSEIRADLRDARKLWHGLSLLLQHRRARQPAAPPSPIEKVEAPPAPEEEAARDDLTTIRGIGPGMEKRLNQAGIYTFTQLAQSAPDDLREMLGDVGRLAKVEDWIERAQEMAS